MNTIPTAEEFLIQEMKMSKIQQDTLYAGYVDAMKAFAKLHVKKALEAAC